jgi:hypothetical protein
MGHARRNHSSGSSIVSNHFHPRIPPSMEMKIEKPIKPINNKRKLINVFFGSVNDVISPIYPTIPNKIDVKIIISFWNKWFDEVIFAKPKNEKNKRKVAGNNPVTKMILYVSSLSIS